LRTEDQTVTLGLKKVSTPPPLPESSRIVLSALTVLTFVSGMADAVSYLGLGHVFTT